MKILYLDLPMGAAGDMLTAALFGLLGDEDKERFKEGIKNLFTENVEISVRAAVKQGISGYISEVKINGNEENGHEHHHVHSHRTLKDMEGILKSSSLSEKALYNALSVYRIITEAEGRVHGEKLHLIHFHEVGELDAAADIISVCMLMEMLSPDMVISSPVNTGSGRVRCAHGILPVPAPATSLISEGLKIYSSGIESELLTPTGAALIKYFTDSQGNMPVMKLRKSSFGFGKKEFYEINAVRAYLGDGEAEVSKEKDVLEESGVFEDKVFMISANIDDMTPEDISYVMDTLFQKGCRDVYLEQVLMKKGRPGFILNALVSSEFIDETALYLLSSTSTIGVRISKFRRYCLERTHDYAVTGKGDFKVGIKTSGKGKYRKIKAEHDDLRKYALSEDISISDARERISKVIREKERDEKGE